MRKEFPQLQPKPLLRKSTGDHRGIHPGAAGGGAAVLRQLQETIHGAIPGAKEKISWSMPTFWEGRNLIQFAASQKHIGLYPGPEAVEVFSDRLAAFPTSKGTIRLPLNQPMPLELIADIARWCEKNNGK